MIPGFLNGGANWISQASTDENCGGGLGLVEATLLGQGDS